MGRRVVPGTEPAYLGPAYRPFETQADPAREGKTLVARQVSLDRATAAEPMARALREAASWVGCDDVRLERVEPAQWAPRLAAALTELS